MYEDLIESAGLTKNESLAYIALLKLGKSKSGDVVKSAKISGGKIYETLYKLIDKGLVKVVSINGIKHFTANDPSSILDYMKEKEKLLKKKEFELEKAIPNLRKLSGYKENLDSVSLIKGFRGIHTLMYFLLNDANSIKIMGVRSGKNIKFNNFWKKWHFERVKLKKHAQIIFSDNDTEYFKHFSKLKYTEVKSLLSFSPSAATIIDNHLLIFSYGEEFTCIDVENSDISNSFANFFDQLWNISK